MADGGLHLAVRWGACRYLLVVEGFLGSFKSAYAAFGGVYIEKNR